MICLITLCFDNFYFFFTLIFVTFTLHGLSASSLGTIVLSLTFPLIIFVVTFFVKKYLKDCFCASNEDFSIINGTAAGEEQLLLSNS